MYFPRWMLAVRGHNTLTARVPCTARWCSISGTPGTETRRGSQGASFSLSWSTFQFNFFFPELRGQIMYLKLSDLIMVVHEHIYICANKYKKLPSHVRYFCPIVKPYRYGCVPYTSYMNVRGFPIKVLGSLA